MAINSIKFIIFSIITVILYYIVPKKKRWVVLLISSYIFYFIASKFLIVFILLSILSIYLAGLLINKENEKLDIDLAKEEKKLLKANVKKHVKMIVTSTVIINVLILLVLKYSNFFISSFNGIFNTKFNLLKIILPLGISYYTLQAISYIVDISRNKYKACNNFFKVSLYMIYFPIITEGPISRFDELSPKLTEGSKINYNNMIDGAGLMLWGYFKKMVIADRCGIYVNNIFGNSSYSGIVVFLAIVLYTIQIYAEFSGCMDIISGLSKTMGIELTKNFERPFFSKSIQEFWRRWHKTLGSWLKDYVFYPISLSKASMTITKFSRKKLGKNLAKFVPIAFSLFFVWFLNGFWHGASWKYILYGLYYYTIMMFGLLCKPLTDKLLTILKINTQKTFYKLFQIIRTWIIVFFGMMLFRSHSTMDALKMFKSIFKTSTDKTTQFGITYIDLVIIMVCVALLFIYGILEEKNINVINKINNSKLPIRYVVYLFIIFGIIIFGMYGPGYNPGDFIYGQF